MTGLQNQSGKPFNQRINAFNFFLSESNAKTRIDFLFHFISFFYVAASSEMTLYRRNGITNLLVIFIATSLRSQALNEVLPFKTTTILMKVFVNIFHTAGLSIINILVFTKLVYYRQRLCVLWLCELCYKQRNFVYRAIDYPSLPFTVYSISLKTRSHDLQE